MFTKKFLLNNLKNFLNLYNQKPIINNYSGMRIEHCYALYSILKKIKPLNIIESGIWRGQTTWLIKKISKKANIFSIDTDLSQRQIILKNVNYLNKDITKYDWSKLDKDRTIIIFDDHVCFSKRIEFLLTNKFKHIIFDDNLPNNFISYYTPKMIVENQILVKKEFINYYNFKRLSLFFINYLKNKKYRKKIKVFFFKSYLIIKHKQYFNKKLNFIMNKFRNKLKLYYEFPPIVKFDITKRFKKLNNKYKINLKNIEYKTQNPITDKKFFSNKKKYLSEMSIQYGNICYIRLK